MKHNYALIYSVAMSLIILDYIDFLHMVVLFLIAGIVPGTDIVISPSTMLTFIVVLASIIIIYTIIMPTISKYMTNPEKQSKSKSTRIPSRI